MDSCRERNVWPLSSVVSHRASIYITAQNTSNRAIHLQKEIKQVNNCLFFLWIHYINIIFGLYMFKVINKNKNNQKVIAQCIRLMSSFFAKLSNAKRVVVQVEKNHSGLTFTKSCEPWYIIQILDLGWSWLVFVDHDQSWLILVDLGLQWCYDQCSFRDQAKPVFIPRHHSRPRTEKGVVRMAENE